MNEDRNLDYEEVVIQINRMDDKELVREVTDKIAEHGSLDGKALEIVNEHKKTS